MPVLKTFPSHLTLELEAKTEKIRVLAWKVKILSNLKQQNWLIHTLFLARLKCENWIFLMEKEFFKGYGVHTLGETFNLTPKIAS